MPNNLWISDTERKKNKYRAAKLASSRRLTQRWKTQGSERTASLPACLVVSCVTRLVTMVAISHGQCRGQGERQSGGCDCFGSRLAFLTTAGPRFLNRHVGPAWRLAGTTYRCCRLQRFAGPAKATSPSSTSRTPTPATHGASFRPTLHVISEALASQSLARSRSPRPIRSDAHNRAVARSEEIRPRSVHGRIGHAREPPLRVQPADACSKPAELQRPHNTNKIENRYENQIKTHPNIMLDEHEATLSRFCFSMFIRSTHSFFAKFPLQKLLLHQHVGEITWRFAMSTRFQRHSDSILKIFKTN